VIVRGQRNIFDLNAMLEMSSTAAANGAAAKLLWTPDPHPTTPRQIDQFQALISAKYSITLSEFVLFDLASK
jgi:hypothetical protein